MTLDNEDHFALKCNVSACNQQISNSTTDPAWITICGHIFCSHCGVTELGNLPVTCPICSHRLTSPFDIVQSELNPPSHFIKMVLMGLHPDICLEAAQNGIQFWQTQSYLQLNCKETAVQATRLQVAEMQSHYEEKMAEMNHEIATLREECHRVKEELKRQKSSLPVSTLCPQTNADFKEQKVEEKPEGKNNTIGNLKKQSYPPPSIPPHLRSLRDNPSKKQFLGKF